MLPTEGPALDPAGQGERPIAIATGLRRGLVVTFSALGATALAPLAQADVVAVDEVVLTGRYEVERLSVRSIPSR